MGISPVVQDQKLVLSFTQTHCVRIANRKTRTEKTKKPQQFGVDKLHRHARNYIQRKKKLINYETDPDQINPSTH